jgi:hypothetical protein
MKGCVTDSPSPCHTTDPQRPQLCGLHGGSSLVLSSLLGSSGMEEGTPGKEPQE